MGNDEGFLNRWSRRKLAEKERQSAAEEQVAARPPTVEADAAIGGEEEVQPPERHPAEDIDIDTLTHEADFKIFLQKGVPAAVKQKALRKLWTLDPVLSAPEKVTDMFNIADTKTWGLGPLRGTSWRVGEGYGWRDVLPETADAPGEPPTGPDIVAEGDLPAPAEPSGEAPSPHDAAAADQVADADPPADDDGEDDGKA